MKKFLTTILCLIMVFTMMPIETGVALAEGVEEQNLEQDFGSGTSPAQGSEVEKYMATATDTELTQNTEKDSDQTEDLESVLESEQSESLEKDNSENSYSEQKTIFDTDSNQDTKQDKLQDITEQLLYMRVDQNFENSLKLLGNPVALTAGPTDDTNYFCITALEDNSTFSLGKVGTPYTVSLEYSTNTNTWIDYTFGTSISLTNKEDKVFLRNKSENNSSFSKGNVTGNPGYENYNHGNNYYKFNFSGQVSVGGDITTLIRKNGNLNQLGPECFDELFSGCKNLIYANELLLPSNSFGKECYYGLFNGCSSLKTSPVLRVNGGDSQAYTGMFNGCSSLSEITVLFTEWFYIPGKLKWVDGVPGGGKFYSLNDNITTPSGEGYSYTKIPSGWSTKHFYNITNGQTIDNKGDKHGYIESFTFAPDINRYIENGPKAGGESRVIVNTKPDPGYRCSAIIYNGNKQTINADETPYFIMPNADATVTAEFTPIIYEVFFDKNYGDGERLFATKTAAYLSKYSEFPEENPTRTGYTFDGWYTDAIGGTEVTSQTEYLTQGPTTLYAHWKSKKYRITYRDEGDNDFSGKNQNLLPSEFTYATNFNLEVPTRPHYIFDGWYLDPNCEVDRINCLEAESYPRDIILYAKWMEDTSLGYELLKNKPICFTNNDNGSIAYVQLDKVGNPDNIQLLFSTESNFTYWNEYSWDGNNGKIIALPYNQSLYFKASGTNSSFSQSEENYYMFKIDSGKNKVNVSGNIMSLLDGDNYSLMTSLSSDTNLTSGTNYDFCFYKLFYDCEVLYDAINLQLPAKELSDSCYKSMFQRCNHLVNSPKILAETLQNNSMVKMFLGCSDMKNIFVNFTSWGDGSNTKEWVASVNTKGSFYCPSSLLEIKDDDHIHSGWTKVPLYSISYNSNCANGAIEVLFTPVLGDRYITKDTEIQVEAYPVDEYSFTTFTDLASINFQQTVQSITGENDFTFDMPADDVYLDAIFEKTDPKYRPLTFTALEDTTQVWLDETGSPDSISILYSTDKNYEKVWKPYNIGTKITLDNIGDKVFFKASGTNSSFSTDADDRYTFHTDKKTNVSGNATYLISENINTDVAAGLMYLFFHCNKLVSASDLVLPCKLSSNCFSSMFFECNSLVAAPKVLPATTLTDKCYYEMFHGCTSLISAPALPATTLAANCYERMFYGCQSLTCAPELPATTLAANCYVLMFHGCESLTCAPELPATSLVEKCYDHMFDYCANLKSIVVGFDTWNTNATMGWLSLVATSGDFYCPLELEAVTGVNNIPTGWRVLSTCSITNNSPESASNTKHGYIAVQPTATNYDNVTVTVVPELGFVLDRIVSSSTEINFKKKSGTNSYEFTMPRKNIDIRAVFVSESDDTGNPINFTALEPNAKIRLLKYGSPNQVDIEYSIDGIQWQDYDFSSYAGPSGKYIVLKNAGDKVYFKNKSDELTSFSTVNNYYYFDICNEGSAGQVAVAGDATTLLKRSGNVDDLTAYGGITLQNLFFNCKRLASASDLILPSTKLSSSCYSSMFEGCTFLKNAPELPATTLTDNCYRNMFSGCSFLENAPKLPAVKLADSCYYGMFENCFELKQAPDLPAKELIANCYEYMFSSCTSLEKAPFLPAKDDNDSWAPYHHMFYGCTSLNEVAVLFENWHYNTQSANPGDNNRYRVSYEWLKNVKDTGTFYCLSGCINNLNSISSPVGNSTIPTGWTIVPLNQITHNVLEASETDNNGYIDFDCTPAAEYNRTEPYAGSGTNVTINVHPNQGYRLDFIKSDEVSFELVSENCYKFTMPNENVNITANFVPNDFQFDKPLCFTALMNDSIVQLNKYGNPSDTNLLYSTDSNLIIWNEYTWSGLEGKEIKLSEGQKVYFKASETNNYFSKDFGNYYYYNLSKDVAASGEVSTLINPSGTDVLPKNCFYRLFMDCNSLKEAPSLSARNLGENCYREMFSNCDNLLEAPILPATVLAKNCYYRMFSNCDGLVKAPALPATSLAEGCYQYMFDKCSNLEVAPALPAMNLSVNCYNSMFNDCDKLEYAPALPATTLTDGCYYLMFDSCDKLKNVIVNFEDWGGNYTGYLFSGDTVASSTDKTIICPSSLITLDTYFENWTKENIIPVENISLSSTEANLKVGSTTDIDVIVTPENATFAESLAYYLSDPSVVSIIGNSNGIITVRGIKVGESVLTIKNTISGKTVDYTISVLPAEVKFDTQDTGIDEPASQTIYNYYDMITKPEIWAPGYKFNGWYKDASSTANPWIFYYDRVLGDTTIYANLEPISYTITFDVGEGRFEDYAKSIPANYNTELTSITPPTRDGYHFGGYQTASGTSYYDENGNGVKKWDIATDTTLYAFWIPNELSITYKDKNGADFSGNHVGNPPNVHIYGSTTNLGYATKTGYTFGGWFDNSDCINASLTSLNATLYKKDITLYAKWIAEEYDINYKDNGGGDFSGTLADGHPTKHTYDKNTTLFYPTKAGYTFNGWFEDASCTNASITNLSAASYTSDITLYAKWTANQYFITFDAEGGSFGQGVSTKTNAVVYDGNYNLPNINPEKTGYTFAGWYTSLDGGKLVTSVTKYETPGNSTLYAHWTTNKYEVTYDANGGYFENGVDATSTNKQMDQYYDSKYNFPVNDPVNGDFIFAGWLTSTATDTGVQYTSSDYYTTATNTTLYAHWGSATDVVEVSFDMKNHGTQISPIISVVKGYRITEPDSPSEDGYTFDGWYKESTCKTKWDFVNDTVVKDTTLYAKWSKILPKMFTVTFNANGQGSAPASYKDVIEGSTIPRPATPSNVTGYTFKGWYKEISCINIWDFDTDIVDEDKELFAKWEGKTYKVTLETNYGTCDPLTSYTYGIGAKLPIPKKSGKTFGGWYSDMYFENGPYTEISKTATGDVKFYAKWNNSSTPVGPGGGGGGGAYTPTQPTTEGDYTVTFERNGHGNPISSIKVKKGSKITEPTKPTTEEYDFVGWYKDANFKTPWNFSWDTVNQNTTLYAKWKLNRTGAIHIASEFKLKVTTKYVEKEGRWVTEAQATMLYGDMGLDTLQRYFNELDEAGFVVKFVYYRSTIKNKSYKQKYVSKTGKYKNSVGTKGKMYYYKARIRIYDQAGDMVATTSLPQCKYGNRKYRGYRIS